MKIKRIAAMAAACLLAVSALQPAFAASTSSADEADLAFYRKKATDTFSGEIDIRNGKQGEVTDVKIKDTDHALIINDFDDDFAYFDSLYKSINQSFEIVRDGQKYSVDADLAVYDSVTLKPQTGSVTLTVKDIFWLPFAKT